MPPSAEAVAAWNREKEELKAEIRAKGRITRAQEDATNAETTARMPLRSAATNVLLTQSCASTNDPAAAQLQITAVSTIGSPVTKVGPVLHPTLTPEAPFGKQPHLRMPDQQQAPTTPRFERRTEGRQASVTNTNDEALSEMKDRIFHLSNRLDQECAANVTVQQRVYALEFEIQRLRTTRANTRANIVRQGAVPQTTIDAINTRVTQMLIVKAINNRSAQNATPQQDDDTRSMRTRGDIDAINQRITKIADQQARDEARTVEDVTSIRSIINDVATRTTLLEPRASQLEACATRMETDHTQMVATQTQDRTRGSDIIQGMSNMQESLIALEGAIFALEDRVILLEGR